DLCTMGELRDMGQRFQVARMLHQGCLYTDIAAKTGASTATISRVNRSLQYGAGGYKQVIENM
ncbi:MAG: YerC/YecD family TrpR-related protein, partial [Oscillospiraceae bacterium]|nr:YerC/YecD family TrpR-related protein [Oscillospiraceae bacterium]